LPRSVTKEKLNLLQFASITVAHNPKLSMYGTSAKFSTNSRCPLSNIPSIRSRSATPAKLEYAFEAEKQLIEAGVPILAGTDAPYAGTWFGVSVHRELELLVRGGMSPAQALL
jgi:imidazolonepropionase-like amidohydrolase